MIYKKIDLNEAVFCNVSEEVAQEYIDFRLSVKKPLTQGAFQRALNEAVKCECLGISANEAIQITIDKGWHGVTQAYIAKELSNRFEASTAVSMTVPRLEKPAGRTTLLQDLTNRDWAN